VEKVYFHLVALACHFGIVERDHDSGGEKPARGVIADAGMRLMGSPSF
jgi:hypothetical protein